MGMPAEKIHEWCTILEQAQHGSAAAQGELAQALWQGKDGFRKNIPKAVEWATAAAVQGDAEYQFTLAELHSSEKEVLDYPKARYWYERAAEQGHQQAAVRLAKVKEEEFARRVAILRQEAEKGNADSQYILGKIYRTDERFRNLRLARFWLSKSAEQSHLEAQFELGELYALTEEEHDLPMARAWYEMAAVQGHAKAKERCVALALLLEKIEMKSRKGKSCHVSGTSTYKKLIQAVVTLWHDLDTSNTIGAFFLLSRLRTGSACKRDPAADISQS